MQFTQNTEFELELVSPNQSDRLTVIQNLSDAGAQMTVSLRSSKEAEWVIAGTWFQQLANLPSCLLLFQDKFKQPVKRVLLAVPSRALVANALAWGFSKHAFVNPVTPLESFPISELASLQPGPKIRLIFPVHRTLPKRQLRVGKLVDVSVRGRITQVQLSTNGAINKYNLLSTVRYSLVQGVTPEGDYWESLEVGEGEEVAKLNFFNSQQNSQALFLTDGTAFEEELKFQFQEPSLLKELSTNELTFEQANRLDQFTNDKHSHFINTWDNFRKFDTYSANLANQLGAFNFIVLDGNPALDSLSQRDELRDAAIIGIFDTGQKTLQARGAQSFLGEAMYSEPIADFEKLLGWQAPDGIRIWGWA